MTLAQSVAGSNPRRRGAERAGCLLLAAVLLACERPISGATADLHDPGVDGLAVGIGEAGVRFVANLTGLRDPESVRYDPVQDVFFVSNMDGYGSVRDANGYIARVSAGAPRRADVFVQSGVDGALLHAPKGMALQGDTLWVADIDVLRAFHRRTGAPLGSVDFAPHGAVLLNDVATAPDGSLRVTDTGIIMGPKGVIHTGPDRVFAVGPGRAVAVVDSGLHLRQPNGVAWDAAAGRWIVVSFDRFAGEVATLGERGARRLLHRGKGQADGVEVLPTGAILYTSWKDSSLHLLVGARDRRLVRGIPEPADIGLDTRRGHVAIPLSVTGRVQLWSLEGVAEAAARGTLAATR